MSAEKNALSVTPASRSTVVDMVRAGIAEANRPAAAVQLIVPTFTVVGAPALVFESVSATPSRAPVTVFEALTDGALRQEFDEEETRVELHVQHADWGSW